MYNGEDIRKAQEYRRENILKGFGIDKDSIEKARSGVYANTEENRKLGRVGKLYGSNKSDDVSKQDNRSGKKDIEEYAKNTSVETLKKVSENDKAPEDLRDAAKKELESRSLKKKTDKKWDNSAKKKLREDYLAIFEKFRGVLDESGSRMGLESDNFRNEVYNLYEKYSKDYKIPMNDKKLETFFERADISKYSVYGSKLKSYLKGRIEGHTGKD